MLSVNFYNEDNDRVHTRVLWKGHKGAHDYLFHCDDLMITNAHDILKEWCDGRKGSSISKEFDEAVWTFAHADIMLTDNNGIDTSYKMDRDEFMDRTYLRNTSGFSLE